MKENKLLLMVFALALWVAAPLTYATPMYSATFQGLTFSFQQTSATRLSFNIAGTPSGDWAGVNYLAAFDLKDLGLCFGNCKGSTPLSTGTANGPGATDLQGSDSQLSAANVDCSTTSNGEKDTICFNLAPDVALGSPPMDFTYLIDFSNPLNISSYGPHLQIAFTDVQGGPKVGSLFSQNVSVPAPAALLLMAFGLLGLGLHRRKKITR